MGNINGVSLLNFYTLTTTYTITLYYYTFKSNSTSIFLVLQNFGYIN